MSWITLGWLQFYSGRLGVIVVDLSYLLFLKTFHYKNYQKCKSISIFFFKNNNIFFLLHKIQTSSINMQNGCQAIELLDTNL